MAVNMCKTCKHCATLWSEEPCRSCLVGQDIILPWYKEVKRCPTCNQKLEGKNA